MPSEPSDGIFDAPAVYRRGAGVGKCPNRHSRQHRNLETRHSHEPTSHHSHKDRKPKTET
ncbi:TPA: hypothetical protein ACFOYH_002104 [Neisseria meningitidis]